MIPIALIAGALGLILSLALRRNTKGARTWQRTRGVMDERFVFMVIPGFSLLLLGAGGLGLVTPGIGGALGTIPGVLLAIITGAVMVGGGIVALLGLGSGPVPTWAAPKWARQDGKGKKHPRPKF